MRTNSIKDILGEVVFDDFFENVHDLIHVVGLDGKIIYTNNAWLKAFGYSFDQIKEHSIYYFITDQDKAVFQRYREEIISGSKPDKELLVRFRKQGGENILIEGSITLHNRKDNGYCTVGIFRDVTDRIETAIHLKEREFNLQQLLQNAPDAIVVINPESDIIFWNPAAEKLFGWNADEVLNKPLAGTIIPPQYREAHYHGMSRFMISKNHGINKTVEITALNKAGEEFYISLTISTTTLNGNMAFISFIRDIRERKRNELELENKTKELEIANEELEQSNSQLEKFAHVASHDIKEPIRKISIYSERLQREFTALPESAKQYVNKIDNAAKRLHNIVDGILNYATAKGVKSEMALVELTNIIGRIQVDLEVLIEEKNAVIKYEQLHQIKGIDFLIYQLFYNLISNSLKFSKANVKPVIEISSAAVSGAESDFGSIDKTREYIQAIVKDNGIGFGHHYADEIFDAFSRLNNRDEYEGTGLGLSLCKSIMERHGGLIIGHGVEGSGATFTMFFPT